MESELIQKKLDETLGKLSRRQLVELDTCARCALCTGKCPIYGGVHEANYSPSVRASKMAKLVNMNRGILTRIRGRREVTEGQVMDLANSVYNCTLCGRCVESCPFGFQTHELWMSLRGFVHSTGCQSAGISRMEAQLSETRNPYGLDPETRLDWVDYTGLDKFPRKDRAEIAYFVGCTAAYKSANQGVAFSIASILNRMGEDWTALGDREWCCGSPVILSGDEEGAREYVAHNVELIEKMGVKRVVTGCSGCFRILKWEYPIILGKKLPFEVSHFVEYLADAVTAGKIKVDPLVERVTYHDPCELARLGGVIVAPRNVLRSFASDFVELPEHGLDSRCCGGGGLLQSSNNDLRLAVIKNRLEQVKSTGAKILTSSCPSCKLAYLDGVREFGYDVEVLDLVELVARQMKIG